MKKNITTIVQILAVVIFVVWLYPYFNRQEIQQPDREEPRTNARCNEEGGEEFAPLTQGTQRILVHILGVATSTSGFTIIVDPIEWLSLGSGTCSTDDPNLSGLPSCNPNGFVINNASSETRTLGIGFDTPIFMQTYSSDAQGNLCLDEQISLAEFTDALAVPGSVYLSLPFSVDIRDGGVIKIVERYIP